jgi:NADPH-dependent curcumin reductase CurA
MKAVVLARYPDGAPVPADFALRDLAEPVPGDGEVLVRVSHLSMDPMPRTRMQPHPPFGPPMALGQPVEGRGVGQVVESRSDRLAPGDWVLGEPGWRERAVLPAARLEKLDGGLPHQHLNALGPTGLAAYFAVDTLGPRIGQTMLVAPGAGAVGNLACQIARHVAPGIRIVGTAQNSAQADSLAAHGIETMMADADWSGGGIDLFVDGVGGAFHDRMLTHLSPRAHVLLLGFIAGYGDAGPPHYGNAGAILMKRARMEGFLLADYMDRADGARDRLRGWLERGVVRPAETLHQGLETAPAAFCALFTGAPPGKQIVELEDGE